MNAFFAFLVVGLLLAFWGSMLAILLAGAVYMWAVLLDELRERRTRRLAKKSLSELLAEARSAEEAQ